MDHLPINGVCFHLTIIPWPPAICQIFRRMLVISVMSQTAFLSCSDNSHDIIDCRRSCSDSHCFVSRDVRGGVGSMSRNLLEDVPGGCLGMGCFGGRKICPRMSCFGGRKICPGMSCFGSGKICPRMSCFGSGNICPGMSCFGSRKICPRKVVFAGRLMRPEMSYKQEIL